MRRLIAFVFGMVVMFFALHSYEQNIKDRCAVFGWGYGGMFPPSCNVGFNSTLEKLENLYPDPVPPEKPTGKKDWWERDA